MWFSLDSSSTWGPSVVSAATTNSNSTPLTSISSSSSLFLKQEIDDQCLLSNSALKKNNLVKPKQLKTPTDSLNKKTPADEFIKISSNQRWGPQSIGFSNIQSTQPEKKTLIPVPIKTIPSPQISSPALTENSLLSDEESTTQCLYKTELCRSFEETGACRYGLKCQFAHGRAELRHVTRHPKYKTEVCKTFHTIGTCPYGKRCRFIHIEQGLLNQNPPTTIKPIPVQSKPALDYIEVVTQNDSGWTNNWFEPTPTSVNVPLSVGTGVKNVVQKPLPIETLPIMKTSNEISQPRSRLVIFQQICS
jgi:butyrate response factor 1